MAQALTFYGTLVHSVSVDEPFVVLKGSVVAVQKRQIVLLETASDEKSARDILASHGFNTKDLQVLDEDEFLMPGMVDTHIHASQYVTLGVGYHLGLLDWLEKFTFPAEARFADVEYASQVYDKVVRRTLRNGTTTASYFATIHVDATLTLADIMNKYGQRGFVGKVCMDQNSPEYYIETTEESLAGARTCIETIKERYGGAGLIEACVTPRFAISCSNGLMSQLGGLAREHIVPVQTHMSENQKEVEEVLSNNPDVKEYVQVYEKAGLLTDRTIIAHCVYSNDTELSIIKKYKSGISHCPNSNTTISSGVMDARKVLRHDIKLGLGTDISGGYSPNLLDSLRKSTEVSKLLSLLVPADGNDGGEKNKPIDYRTAFFFATLGGAQVMGLHDKIGNFMVGKEFDALRIRTRLEDGAYDAFDVKDVEELIQKFLYCGDDRNIMDVFVAGKKIDVRQQNGHGPNAQ